MTKQVLMEAIHRLTPDQELRWMIHLGAELTIAARGGYPVGEYLGNITHLVAFNEMQHQLYNRLRHFQVGSAWNVEVFLDTLHRLSVHHRVGGELGWALTTSLRPFK